MTRTDMVAFQVAQFLTKPRIMGIELPAVSRWDPSMLREKLAALGFGLLVIEGDAVSESLPAKERKLDLHGVAKSALRPR